MKISSRPCKILCRNNVEKDPNFAGERYGGIDALVGRCTVPTVADGRWPKRSMPDARAKKPVKAHHTGSHKKRKVYFQRTDLRCLTNST